MLYIIGIAITLFLSFILTTKKNKSQADKILTGWLYVIALHLSLFTLISTGQFLKFPYLLGIEIPLPLLHGPFLFLYVRSLTSPDSLSKKSLSHLIPYLITLLSLSPFFILETEEKITVYLEEGSSYQFLLAIIFTGVVLSGICYIILSLSVLLKYKRKILEEYSYTERINLQWLLYLISGLGILWIVILFSEDKYIFSSVVVYVAFIGYFGIKQVGIFTNLHPTLVPEKTDTTIINPTSNPLTLKYEKTALAEEHLDNLYKKLNQLMGEKKLFQTPELTLAMVAEDLNTHPNSLSQVINRMEQKNFFDYINHLRVEEFKLKVAQPENQKYTLLAIAMDCGFNSKTSFNRNFKKVTGLSPTEYLNDARISLE